MKLVLKHDIWENYGSNTLQGLYANEFLRLGIEPPKEITLEVHQTSMDYRRQNGGPAELIIPEFMPLCLIQDILSMQNRHGITINIEVKEIHKLPSHCEDCEEN